MKEQYRKANDQIPVNQELLAALKEKAAAPVPKRVRPMRQAGLVLAAVLLGVTLFSLSDLQQIRPQPRPGILGSEQEQSGLPLKKTIPSSDRDNSQTAEHQTEQQTTKIPSTAKAPSGQSHKEAELNQQITQPEQETKEIEKTDSIDLPATASARIVADDQTPQESLESVTSLSALPTPEPDDATQTDRMSSIASSEPTSTDSLVSPSPMGSGSGSGSGMQPPVKMPDEGAVGVTTSPTPTPNGGTAIGSATVCPPPKSGETEEPTPTPTPTPSPQPSPSEDSEEK